MLSLIAFLFVLGVLVIVHEFGHFITAKRLGVRVEKFSIGFGPKLYSIVKGETEYALSAIPLGGYVKLAGDDPSEALKNQRWEFLSRPVFDRFRIIVAGPLFNYVLAFLIFSFIFMFGNPTLTTTVGSLLKDYPAESAGILVGDKITAIDGSPVKYWEDMTAIIHKHTEGPVNVTIERGYKKLDIIIKPLVRETKDIFGKSVKIALIGVAPSQNIESVRHGFIESFVLGFNKVVSLTVITVKAIWSIIAGRISLRESMTGPIGIFVITGQAAKLGLVYIAHLMAILSTSLAIFNLFPLPVLDGGHILFLAIEKLRGRPFSLKTQDMIAKIGVAFLIALTALIFYSDIVKFNIVGKIIKMFTK